MRNNLLAGAMAGALGGLAMKAVVYFVDRDSFGLSSRTDAAATYEVWRRLNRAPVSQKSAERIGAAMHYGFAIAAGALYAEAATRFPSTRLGRGTAFGTALWLIGDEVAVSALGLEHPFRTPISSHLSALAAHILYGMIVDSVQGARSQAHMQ
jgi:Protein of unknown function (DUF1440)